MLCLNAVKFITCLPCCDADSSARRRGMAASSRCLATVMLCGEEQASGMCSHNAASTCSALLRTSWLESPNLQALTLYCAHQVTNYHSVSNVSWKPPKAPFSQGRRQQRHGRLLAATQTLLCPPQQVCHLREARQCAHAHSCVPILKACMQAKLSADMQPDAVAPSDAQQERRAGIHKLTVLT